MEIEPISAVNRTYGLGRYDFNKLRNFRRYYKRMQESHRRGFLQLVAPRKMRIYIIKKTSNDLMKRPPKKVENIVDILI